VRRVYREYWWVTQGKETTRKTKTKSVDNIKIELRKIGWGCVDWINLVEDRNQWRALVKAVINLLVL
jgi:hypothetical protein